MEPRVAVTISGAFPAKFPGWCLTAGDEIKEGDSIRFAKGVGAWHVACGEPRSLDMYVREAEQKAMRQGSVFER